MWYIKVNYKIIVQVTQVVTQMKNINVAIVQNNKTFGNSKDSVNINCSLLIIILITTFGTIHLFNPKSII